MLTAGVDGDSLQADLQSYSPRQLAWC